MSSVCIKRNVLRDEPGDVCDVNEDKPIYTSSAPVQIASFKQTPRGQDTIAFSFQIVHNGAGKVYSQSSETCEDTQQENKVYVEVVNPPEGLDCSALGGTAGEISMSESSGRMVTCTYRLPDSRSDYVQPISLRLSYNYEQMLSTSINVKPIN